MDHSNSESEFDATVVIVSKNRAEELRKAIGSAISQVGAKIEVLVIDDGSTDGTAEMVRREFVGVGFHREERSLGLVVERNRGAKLAKGRILFSIDDDAVFSTPNVVAQTVADFEDERIGAVAIPFIDTQRGPEVKQVPPNRGGIFVTPGFIGTAHAVRREIFNQLGGYREHLFHQGEEGDFCIRMLEAGYVVRLGRADPIHHNESPRRDFRRMDLYGRRNDVLFAWQNVPMPELLVKLPATTVGGLVFGMKVGRPWRMAQGLAKGYWAIGMYWGERRAVRRETYRIYRSLQRGARELGEVATGLVKSR